VSVRRLPLLLLVLLACGTSLPVVTPLDAQRAGVAEAELNQGRKLYGARCSVCHAPHAPKEFKPGEWPALVAEMKERAKITDAEQAQIERYLVTLSQQ
jgi:mono/diheme cytochrome c family protein